MRVETYLWQIQKYDRMIEQKRERLDALRQQAYGTAVQLVPDKVQKTGSHDRMGDIATEICVQEQALNQFVKRRERIIRQIDGITDLRCFTVLSYRYISNKTNKEIAYEMKITTRQVGRIFKKAHEMFAEKYGMS